MTTSVPFTRTLHDGGEEEFEARVEIVRGSPRTWDEPAEGPYADVVRVFSNGFTRRDDILHNLTEAELREIETRALDGVSDDDFYVEMDRD